MARHRAEQRDLALRERILCVYHEWGFATGLTVAKLLNDSRRRCERYCEDLLDDGYLLDLGLAFTEKDSALKGRWFASSRRDTDDFCSLPTRSLTVAKKQKKGEEGSPYTESGNGYDILTREDYWIPRHHAWTSYAVGWVARALSFHFGTDFYIESKHLIESRLGHNPHLTAPQRVTLRAPQYTRGRNLRPGQTPSSALWIRK